MNKTLFLFDVSGEIDCPNELRLLGLTEQQRRALDNTFAALSDETKKRVQDGFSKLPRLSDFPDLAAALGLVNAEQRQKLQDHPNHKKH
jgi:hypothetical protein